MNLYTIIAMATMACFVIFHSCTFLKIIIVIYLYYIYHRSMAQSTSTRATRTDTSRLSAFLLACVVCKEANFSNLREYCTHVNRSSIAEDSHTMYMVHLLHISHIVDLLTWPWHISDFVLGQASICVKVMDSTQMTHHRWSSWHWWEVPSSPPVQAMAGVNFLF